MSVLMSLLAQVAYQWRLIGVQLEFHYGTLNNITASKPHAGVMEYLLDLMTRWLGSHEASLEQLLAALRDPSVKQRNLAQTIEDHFRSRPVHG